ncbi:putative quinone oxidoreductase [Tetrabaena socialis]|uniref:Putative quinone oxidoreductase n=1 Tax=Tetrabaena socialis TaxID=47790 RepID=A0A2J8ADJ3_9CHLO|nr:putative quinone oxidoreductase [Tetrabaena socialis]|eukprot:PNH10584.1 putative quinone oxidoreductase [Tetrabaena socialis]
MRCVPCFDLAGPPPHLTTTAPPARAQALASEREFVVALFGEEADSPEAANEQMHGEPLWQARAAQGGAHAAERAQILPSLAAPRRSVQSFPLGAEGVGVVVALGPAAEPPAAAAAAATAGAGAGAGAARRRDGRGGGLAVGQHVAVNGASAFAEYVTARAALVEAVEAAGPEAAALALSGVTACVALEATARVQPGEVMVVTAAAGGTGHLALQLARLAGAEAVAVVGGERKAEAARALGAHHVINYRQEDVVARLRSLYPGGVDVVYEGGGVARVGYISEYPHTHGHSAERNDEGSPVREARPADPSSHGLSATTAGGSTAGSESVSGSGSAGRSGSDGGRGGTEGSGGDGRGAAAGEVPGSAEVFWGGLDVALEGGRRIIGNVWPKDLKSIVRCRRRVFSLARSGELRVLTDQGHGQQGVAGVAAAVDYMLRGEHVGKVVVRISDP